MYWRKEGKTETGRKLISACECIVKQGRIGTGCCGGPWLIIYWKTSHIDDDDDCKNRFTYIHKNIKFFPYTWIIIWSYLPLAQSHIMGLLLEDPSNWQNQWLICLQTGLFCFIRSCTFFYVKTMLAQFLIIFVHVDIYRWMLTGLATKHKILVNIQSELHLFKRF